MRTVGITEKAEPERKAAGKGAKAAAAKKPEGGKAAGEVEEA